ncbi:DUF1659 domain-containing protein [Sediminibacillus halophilus]|uniref:DUF1659 domain-containing protein n=1 Tax=Sediminibacillus halophilus TaxID=482461 RepID=A0A1G9U5V0_9BACI|nr:DUF1659 domain-containing protein [Sediminibacillus halophilus]SDM55291.1 Protein of unknown function [Sediminibacillus halophilus]
MADTQKVDSRLQLVFQDGVDGESGDPILKNKTFNNVKTAATADQLMAISTALVDLQQRELYSIKRNDSLLISE